MSFEILTVTPSSAVATNGTIAFTISPIANGGQFIYQGKHTAYAEGLQSNLTFPTDFSLSLSGATLTLTYLGTTSIPAGTAVKLQLDLPGGDNYLASGPSTLYDAYGNFRGTTAGLFRLSFGAPAAASATAVVNASARAGTVTTTYTNPVVLDIPRTLAVKSSTTDTTQVVTVKGLDEYGVAVTENFTLNGTTAVVGNKAFKKVISDKNDLALAGNLSIGTNAGGWGFPFFIPGGTTAAIGYVVKEIYDGTAPTAGTVIGGDLTLATATTKDVRGVYNPNGTANGAHIWELLIMASDSSAKGVPQFGT